MEWRCCKWQRGIAPGRRRSPFARHSQKRSWAAVEKKTLMSTSRDAVGKSLGTCKWTFRGRSSGPFSVEKYMVKFMTGSAMVDHGKGEKKYEKSTSWESWGMKMVLRKVQPKWLPITEVTHGQLLTTTLLFFSHEDWRSMNWLQQLHRGCDAKELARFYKCIPQAIPIFFKSDSRICAKQTLPQAVVANHKVARKNPMQIPKHTGLTM